jgi:hypothetical protein
MCCFSLPVKVVSDTSIFARRVNGRQFLVYSMTYAAATDVAMVLPLPVPPGPPENAVRFINLAHYPTFFDDMAKGFPPSMRAMSLGLPLTFPAPKLRVHDVGSFEASFVPQLDDFDRLDARFRIPRDVWDRIPEYRDYGFAVFKLKRSSLWGHAWPRRVHPMAFEFPQRHVNRLYFPTVHIHDQAFHADAHFDHALYYQSAQPADDDLWPGQRSATPASEFVDLERARGIVASNEHCWRVILRGRLENKDYWLRSDGAPTPGRLRS